MGQLLQNACKTDTLYEIVLDPLKKVLRMLYKATNAERPLLMPRQAVVLTSTLILIHF